MKLFQFVLLISITFLSFGLFGQYKVSGVVSDENGAPIPFAKVYIQNAPDSRTIANIDGYYELRLYEGEYYFVITSTGYVTKESYVSVSNHEVVTNFSLSSVRIQDIENVNVSAKKTNPGREIMLKVVRNIPLRDILKQLRKLFEKKKKRRRIKERKTKKSYLTLYACVIQLQMNVA